MSRELSLNYILEQEIKQKIANERICAKTEEFYQRYKKQYDEMVQKGMAEMMPKEMERLDRDLQEIRSYLNVNDGEESRRLSREVGAYIYSYWGLGRAVAEQFSREERMRREKIKEERRQNQSALMDAYYSSLMAIKDPIISSFAQNELSQIKEDIIGGRETHIENLRSRFNQSIAKAENQAGEWKTKKKQTQAQADTQKMLDEQEDLLNKSKIEDKERAAAFVQKLHEIQSCLTDNKQDMKTVHQQIIELQDNIEKQEITESMRREVVISIVKQLQGQEFTVKPPRIQNGKVLIQAERPSGKRAQCLIDLQGHMKYRMDNYEGQTCLKDIEKFKVDLANIYDVRLSDERVIWENPDRLYQDAEQNQGSKNRGGNI